MQQKAGKTHTKEQIHKFKEDRTKISTLYIRSHANSQIMELGKNMKLTSNGSAINISHDNEYYDLGSDLELLLKQDATLIFLLFV